MRIKKNGKIQLAKLVKTSEPYAVLEEVKHNFLHHYALSEFDLIRKVFDDFILLYSGRYPGYRSCNTVFHDTEHVTDALLAFSRLIDGYNIENKTLPLTPVKIGLISTILHDSGYIQKKDDTDGTGAKYTLSHDKRSVEFVKKYFPKIGFTRSEIISSSNMINCTGLAIDVDGIKFKNKTEAVLGYMLGTADLISQMASRSYLERLVFLYHEFKEGGVPGFKSEYDLLEKTNDFYKGFIMPRLQNDFYDLREYVRVHFRERYRIDEDLYIVSIERQLKYLKDEVLKSSPKTYCKKLKRWQNLPKEK